MSEQKAVMPYSHYVDTCNLIRQYTKNSEKILSGDLKNQTELAIFAYGEKRYAVAMQDFYEHIDGSLLDLFLPEGIKTIRAYACFKSPALQTVTIVDSVTSIGAYAFADCPQLHTIYFEGQQPPTIDPTAFLNCPLTAMYIKDAQVVADYQQALPDFADIIKPLYSAGLAFEYDEEYDDYTVTGIGTCTAKNIVIPDTYNNKPVTVIGPGAFQNQYTITNITMPSSIEYIYSSAFAGCYGLSRLTIPANVKTIYNNIVTDCYNLKTITFKGTPTGTIDANAFAQSSITMNITDIYVPWVRGAVSNAPWGANSATIHYAPTV